jgi:hypothetical protein
MSIVNTKTGKIYLDEHQPVNEHSPLTEAILIHSQYNPKDEDEEDGMKEHCDEYYIWGEYILHCFRYINEEHSREVNRKPLDSSINKIFGY